MTLLLPCPTLTTLLHAAVDCKKMATLTHKVELCREIAHISWVCGEITHTMEL